MIEEAFTLIAAIYANVRRADGDLGGSLVGEFVFELDFDGVEPEREVRRRC